MPDALRLTLGGAPQTWHAVIGLPGFYHPHTPTPVGGPGEATLQQAKAAHADHGAPVELLKITAQEAAAARVEIEQLIREARNLVQPAREAGESPWTVAATQQAIQPDQTGNEPDADDAAGDTP